jgi:ABC-type antimicrobial peptide transport system permease subunit
MVTRQGLTLAVIGIGLGMTIAQLAGVFFEDLLFQTRTSDPWAIVVAGTLLLMASAVACAAPAWRAARVAPVEGLKDE